MNHPSIVTLIKAAESLVNALDLGEDDPQWEKEKLREAYLAVPKIGSVEDFRHEEDQACDPFALVVGETQLVRWKAQFESLVRVGTGQDSSSADIHIPEGPAKYVEDSFEELEVSSVDPMQR